MDQEKDALDHPPDLDPLRPGMDSLAGLVLLVARPTGLGAAGLRIRCRRRHASSRRLAESPGRTLDRETAFPSSLEKRSMRLHRHRHGLGCRICRCGQDVFSRFVVASSRAAGRSTARWRSPAQVKNPCGRVHLAAPGSAHDGDCPIHTRAAAQAQAFVQNR